MSHRFDQSRQRNYSELCNRSSSRSSMMGPPVSYAIDPCEDYWEDASVSIRSLGHSHDVPSAGTWLGGGVSAEEEGESELFIAPASRQIRPRRDSNEYTACSKRRHSFPPPLALCSSILSIKEGGRFVLKEMDADRPHRFLRVQRGNGRLRLQLVLTDEDDDEEDDQEESCTAEVGATESNSVNCCRDCSAFDSNGSASISVSDEAESDAVSDENGNWSNRSGCHGDHCLEDMVYSDASLPWEEAAMNGRAQKQVGGDRQTSLMAGDGGHHHLAGKETGLSEISDGFLAFHSTEFNQFTAESASRGVEEEPLWTVGVSNQAMASLSPWTAKHLCLQASPLASMRPSIGLAMS